MKTTKRNLKTLNAAALEQVVGGLALQEATQMESRKARAEGWAGVGAEATFCSEIPTDDW